MSVNILVLIPTLSEGFEKYSEKHLFQTFSRDDKLDLIELDYIVVDSQSMAEEASKLYSTLENDIKIICFGEVKNYKEFFGLNGRICISSEMESAPHLEQALDNFFSEKQSLHLDQNYSDEFSGTKNFTITNHLTSGVYIDQLVLDAFKEDFNPVAVRGYADHMIAYFTYLKQAGLAGIPYEVEYTSNSDFFIVNAYISVTNFVSDYMLDSFGDINSKEPLKYLMRVIANSTDLLEITYLEKPGRVAITGHWHKEISSECPSIIFNNIFSHKETKLRQQEQAQSYEQVEETFNQFDKESEALTSKNLPGNIDVNSEQSDLVAVMLLKAKEQRISGDGLTAEEVTKLIAGDDGDENLVRLSNEEKKELLDGLSKIGMSNDLVNEIEMGKGSSDEQKDKSEIVKGAPLEKEHVQVIKGESQEKEKDFKQVISGSNDKKKDEKYVIKSTVDSKIEQMSYKISGGNGADLPKNMKANLKLGLKEFASSIGKKIDDLSEEDYSFVNTEILPNVIEGIKSDNSQEVANAFRKKLSDKFGDESRDLTSEKLKEAETKNKKLELKLQAIEIKNEATETASKELTKINSIVKDQFDESVESRGENNEGLELKRLEFELRQKDNLFQSELEKVSKSLKGKEIVLEKTISRFTKLVKDKEAENEELSNQVTELNKRLENDEALVQEQENSTLKKENELLKKNTDILKGRLEALSKSKSQSNVPTNNDSIQNENKELRQLKNQLANKAEELQREVKSWESRFVKSKELEQRHRDEISQLKSSLEDSKASQGRIRQEEAARLAEATKISQASQSQQESREVQNLKNQNTQLQKKIKDLIAKGKGGSTSAGQGKAGGMSSREKLLESDKKRLQADLGKSRGEVDKSKKILMKFKGENTKLQHEVSKYKRDVDKLSRQLRAIKEKSGKKAA